MIKVKKQTVHSLVEEVEGKGKYDLVNSLLASDFRGHMPFAEVDGRDQYIATTKMLRATFPDMEIHLSQLIAEDDLVAIRLTATGTQMSEFLGLPPSGREIQMNSAAFFRIAGGKIVEGWSFPDLFGLMKQLGAIPKQESI